MELDKEALKKEFTFSTARAGGPGGQHVNKVESKVILTFDIEKSKVLNDKEKQLINLKLKKYISKNGILLLYNQETRSQLLNKQRVTNYFFLLLKKAFFKAKKRKKSTPSKASKEKRLKEKRIRSDVKRNRRGDHE